MKHLQQQQQQQGRGGEGMNEWEHTQTLSPNMTNN